jgi:hypothetical protein
MKAIFLSPLLVAVTLFAMSARAQRQVHPNYKPSVPGLDYAFLQTTNWNNGEPWSIHIARLDRSQKNLRVAESLAHQTVLGTAPVSAIAKSFPRERGEPLVAINAGFCNRVRGPYIGASRGIGKSADASMVITDREVAGAPSKYNFIVNEDGSMHFGNFEPRFAATLPNGETVPLRLNNECKSNSVVLFTHILGATTRATNHLEVILENSKQQSLSWNVGKSYTLRVKAVNPAGNTPLSSNIAVLCFSSEMASKASGLHAGDTIKVELKTLPELKNVVTACHMIFPLVEKGKVLEKFDGRGAILHKNPRTAIGFNDRYFYMVVVDGRQKSLSTGMTAKELAEFMASIGRTEAANLDGGGSSTFWMGGERRNSVPGGIERTRGDALLIVQNPPRKMAQKAIHEAGE